MHKRLIYEYNQENIIDKFTEFSFLKIKSQNRIQNLEIMNLNIQLEHKITNVPYQLASQSTNQGLNFDFSNRKIF